MKMPLSRFIPLFFCVATGLAMVPLARSAETPAAEKIVMNDELMQRLIIFAVDQQPHTIPACIGKVFDLCDGSKNLPLYLLQTERPEGTHMGVSVDPEHKDIVILHRLADGNFEAYLTNKSRKLRASAITNGPDAHLITNEKGEEKFEIALNQFAREAAEDLPPTNAPVAPPPSAPAK